jgi:integral membrane sensor domain MASE1
MVKGLINSLAPRNLALLASVTLVHFLAGRLGLRLSFVHPYVTPVWIPSAVALAALILFGYRMWPAVLVGTFLDHATRAGFVPNTFSVPFVSTLQGVVGAYLVNKFAKGAKAFDTAKGVFLFASLTCVCASLINPTFNVGINYLRGSVSLADVRFRWLTSWLAHGIGSLLIAPFLILLLRSSHHRLDLREFGELTVLVLGLIFVCLLVFSPLSLSLNKTHVVQVWLCVPFLIWAGFRFCPLEAAGTTLILFGSAIWGTLHGYGSFVAENLTTSLILLNTFVGVIGTMALVVAAMVVERRRIEEELLGTQSLLQEAVERKERDLLVTVQSLEVEAAGHVQTKRALRKSQERLRRIVGEAKFVEKIQESKTR